MPTTLTIATPHDYRLTRDVCSYGYFLLAPNRWDPHTQTLHRPLALHEGNARFAITQAPRRDGATLKARADRSLTRREQQHARQLIARMLSLGDPGVREFHRLDPRFAAAGRARLFRSPTLFEDIIKTVTSCNVAWPSTVTMNQRLCSVINPAFPTPSQLARRRPETLRARCRVGYRDKRIVELAKIAAKGLLPEQRWADPNTTDDDVRAELIALPGIGPYAANNIMQLLGRFGHIPVDTETLRHARVVLGFTGNDSQLAERVRRHYAPFGRHAFRSYWFELWEFYERKRGPSHLWERDSIGRTFTAALLKDNAAPHPTTTTRNAQPAGNSTSRTKRRVSHT